MRLSAFASAFLGCADQGVRPSQVAQLVDSADQVMLGMTTNIVAGGVRRSYVQSETTYVYQARQEMDLRRMQARFFDEQGNHKSTLTAERGVYGMVNESLDARGNVVVQTTDGRRLTTPHLIYDKTANLIRSDSPFVYQSPTERLTGNGFQTDPDFRNLVVQQPRGRQRGQGVLLPGQ